MKDGTYIVRVGKDGLPSLSEPLVMSNGYWVSTDGVAVHGKLDSNGIVSAMQLMELYDGAVVGIWEEKGITYIDKSIHISNREQAIKAGKLFDQLAIYDCNKNQIVEL